MGRPETHRELGVSDPAANPCDITQPAPFEPAIDRELNRLRAEHEAWAQYRMVASKWGWKLVLGGYYDLSTSRKLERVMWEACTRAMPGHDAWTKPLFNVEGVGGNFRTDGRAEVGDVAAYEVSTPPVMTVSGCMVGARYWVLGLVTKVDSDGRVAGVSSYSGEAIHEATRYEKTHILPAQQFDMVAVKDDLQQRSELRRADGLHSCSRGIFHDRVDASGALSKFLLPRVAQRIRAEDVERAVAHASNLFDPPFRYLPINLPALQAEIDGITKSVSARHQARPEPLLLAA
jgi:hypothetical protein